MTGYKYILKIKFNKAVFVLLAFFAISLSGCKENTEYKKQLEDSELFRSAMKRLTDVIVYDVFSPPVASRVYMYPSIASYAIMQKAYPNKYNTLVGQVNGFTEIPDPKDNNINLNLASLHAFIMVGKQLIFSEDKLIDFRDETYAMLKESGLPEKVLNASIEYGNQVAEHILKWADGDLYKQTRTFPQYSIIEEPQYWKPTPPNYMQGIEPHWGEIRTLVLKSGDQFKPIPPIPFDLTKGSPFMKQVMGVYENGGKINNKNEDIAKFWDCNPYVLVHQGHTMLATKKITPGGHWIAITEIASRKANSSFDETINAYTNVSISLFDAFISCWDEKWRSLVVRPETIINQYIDKDWEPFLQTPPFPEYTSGHSVISRAAAVVLTDLYGDKFHFSDTSEIEYGLPVREFKSFIHASEEAAISRHYGGIHYMMAIEEGVSQGQKVGSYIVQNIQTLK